MNKGKVIIPIAVIMTIIIASVSAYFLYQLISGDESLPRGRASHLRSSLEGFVGDPYDTGASLETAMAGKRACDLNPGIRVSASAEDTLEDGSREEDSDYYRSTSTDINGSIQGSAEQ